MNHPLIPFYSQRTAIKDKAWTWRSCGIASTKMILAYWHERDERNASPIIAVVLKKARETGAYIQNIGWSHPGLVKLVQSLGYQAYNKDYATLTPQEAWEHTVADLDKYPLIASVWSRFDPHSGDGHLIVLNGYDDNNVYITDPAEITEAAGRKIMPKDKFFYAWKRRYIAIYPRSDV